MHSNLFFFWGACCTPRRERGETRREREGEIKKRRSFLFFCKSKRTMKKTQISQLETCCGPFVRGLVSIGKAEESERKKREQRRSPLPPPLAPLLTLLLLLLLLQSSSSLRRGDGTTGECCARSEPGRRRRRRPVWPLCREKKKTAARRSRREKNLSLVSLFSSLNYYIVHVGEQKRIFKKRGGCRI